MFAQVRGLMSVVPEISGYLTYDVYRLIMKWDQYPKPLPDQETGCIRWMGPHIPGGYGRLSGPTRLAHREAWERVNGAIPRRGIIDHVWAHGCRHKDCVNIDHLELVTNTENARRSVVARGGRRSWKDTDTPGRAGQGGKSPSARRRARGL